VPQLLAVEQVDHGEDLGGVDGLADADRDAGVAHRADEAVEVPGQSP